MRNRIPNFNRPKLLIGIAVVGLLGLAVSRATTIVPAGHVGIIDTFGQVADRILQPGLHLRNPLSKIVHLSVQTQEFKETTQTPSKEGLMMDVDVSILYRLNPEQAKAIYQTVGTNYVEVVVLPEFRSLIRNTTAQFNAQEIYTSQRQAVAQKIRQDLAQVVSRRGVIVEDTPLRNVTLPQNLSATIESKLQADQESQRMEFVLSKEKQEADRKKIAAQGEAEAQKILATGLSDQVLRLREIEAMQKIADSKNTKVVVMGTGSKGVMIQP
jgi:regulator of protease activity HflC (stomatin/prohibitin superfamily)